MRVTTDLWVSALLRRVQSAGGFAALLRRGFAEAGAVFLTVRTRAGETIVFGPAPQTSYGAGGDDGDRRFVQLLRTFDPDAVSALVDKECRFDPDAWVVELETANGEPQSYFRIVNG